MTTDTGKLPSEYCESSKQRNSKRFFKGIMPGIMKDLNLPKLTKPTGWEELRWRLMTSQLKEIAKILGLETSDIPDNTQQKERLATRIARHLDIPIPERGKCK